MSLRAPVICAKHSVAFVRFMGMQSDVTHGCPVCVGLARAKVRMERSRPGGSLWPRWKKVPLFHSLKGTP